MKRLISLCTLLLLILASCDAPVSQLDKDKDTNHSKGDISAQLSYNPSSALTDTNRQAVWQQFKSLEGTDWRITWNDKTGLPLTIFSGKSKVSYTGSPEQAARTFLNKHISLFGMKQNLTDLELDRVHRLHGITHVRFQQTYRGIPVWEGDYAVHLRSNGRVDMANGNYYSSIEVPTSPSISEASARQKAVNDLGTDVPIRGEIESQLVVYPEKNEQSFLLAWKILVPAVAPVGGNWQFFVDATNGAIIEKVNLATSVTGDGDIIEDHPDLTPNTVNRDFYRLDGSGYLRGTYANVHNDVSSRAFSSSHTFQYSTSNTHFDEANVYWHIDTYRADYLDNLGFDSDIGSDQDLEAYVHDVTNDPGGAGYYPTWEEVRFGNNYEFAKEDKIIYHEFNHAVADVVNDGITSSNDEEGAISEGNADFFAGSYAGRSLILDSLPFDNRDMASPEISSYSQYQNDSRYPNVPPHDGGEFWSAILWDLRGNIGASTTDFLAFDAMGRVSGDPTFIEYRDAMMAADDAAFSGSNNDQIQNTFADRGVGTHVPPSVSISGPSNMFEGTSDTFTANVSGGQSPYTYQWYYKHESDPSWTLASGETSSTYTHTAGPPNGEYVKVSVTDSRSANNEAQHFFTITGACC